MRLRKKVVMALAVVLIFGGCFVAVASSVSAHDLTITPASGDDGEISKVVSGRVYADSLPFDALPASINQFAGITRRIRIEETAPSSVINQDFAFTLTDADGNTLYEAKIAAVHFTSGVLEGRGEPYLAVSFGEASGTAFHNSVPAQGQTRIIGHNNIRGVARGTGLAIFSEDGHSVTVSGLRANDPHHHKMWLEATFFISVDVNFEGDVFVTLSTSNAASIYPSATIQIAEVKKLFDIQSAPIYLTGRYPSISPHDVTISERQAGAFVCGRQIELVLSDGASNIFDWTGNVGLNPIAQRDISTTGSLDVSPLPQRLGSGFIPMKVNEQSTQTPSALTLSNLSPFIGQAAPIGAYGIMARGNAILDNDFDMANPYAPEFRRYGFRGGLIFEPYIKIFMPGGVYLHSDQQNGGWTIARPNQGQETTLQILVERQSTPENAQFRADWVRREGHLTGGVVYSTEIFKFDKSGDWQLRVVTLVDGNEVFANTSRIFRLNVQDE
ncbi:MAG: hypothetical protein FWC76_06465 [Defluviitaleaceae bacterium]|nr:hypothetical protein [Defluviitaleaceae bacterium]